MKVSWVLVVEEAGEWKFIPVPSKKEGLRRMAAFEKTMELRRNGVVVASKVRVK